MAIRDILFYSKKFRRNVNLQENMYDDNKVYKIIIHCINNNVDAYLIEHCAIRLLGIVHESTRGCIKKEVLQNLLCHCLWSNMQLFYIISCTCM